MKTTKQANWHFSILPGNRLSKIHQFITYFFLVFTLKSFDIKRVCVPLGFNYIFLNFPLNLYMQSPGRPSSFLNSLIETCQESSTAWSPNQCCTFEVFFTAVSHFQGPASVPVTCCCSVTKSCPTLCDPKDCGMPGFPVLRYLLESAQTHLHWVDEPPTISSSVIPFSSCPQFFPGGSDGKASAYSRGDPGSIPGSGRFPWRKQ